MRTLVVWITDMLVYWLTGINGNEPMNLYEFVVYVYAYNKLECIVSLTVLLFMTIIIVMAIEGIGKILEKKEVAKKIEAES